MKTEFRRDPILGQWVLVQTHNDFAPGNYEKEDRTVKHKAICQFCPGKEQHTPPEVSALRPRETHANTPGWKVRVVSNKFPALKIEGNFDEENEGILSRANGIGAHEVVIETTDHEKNFAQYTQEEVKDIIGQYQQRLNDLTGDKRFKYITIFKNYGESAGTTVEHAHSQIIALPMIPKYVKQELEGAQDYYRRNNRCVFCDILEQELSERNRIVTQNEDYVALCPFASRYPFECWIIPKKHSATFADIDDSSQNAFAHILKETLTRLHQSLSDPSYNFYIHIAPVNDTTYPDFHWHIEIIPKLMNATGFELGTGFYVVRTSPEKGAHYLRGGTS